VKIVLVLSSFPKLSESFIVSKFLGLTERGWDFHLVCGESKESEWLCFPQLMKTAKLRRRVHVTWSTEPRWRAALLLPWLLLRCFLVSPSETFLYLYRGWSRFGFDVLRRFYVDAELIALRPQLIHFEFGSLAAGRMYLKDLLDCKVICSFRGYDLNYVGLETADYYAEVWTKADALHFLGDALWRCAQRRGCPPGKTHVLIPPTIDCNSFGDASRRHAEVVGIPKRPLRILSVGRLEWVKGYEYGLQAVKLLVEQGLCCEYRIIGDGKEIEAIAFARHQLGLEDEVEFAGARPRADVLTSMLWADVFLHPAVSEGFCNAALEAQAMRLPVVCTDAGGLPENVLDDETGFVVPRRNARALADKLSLLAQDAQLRQRLGQAGCKRAQTHFRLEGQVSSFERLYQRVLMSEVVTAERSRDPQMLPAAQNLEKR
jgi:colanic acid/amylovoran biosynthesis glycosyltransferase